MKAITVRSHKAGQGTSVTACALALALHSSGRDVALVSNDVDTLAILGMPETHDIFTDVKDGLRLYSVGALGALDTVGLAGLVGLSDIPAPRHDVIVTDLGDDTPTRATLAAHGFTEPQSVEVVTACYLALRRSTQATHRGAERQHVVLIRDAARALTAADVKSVLRPTGELVALDRSEHVARSVDAGLLVNRLGAGLDPLAEFAESVMIDAATHAAANTALKARKAASKARATN